jgi:hypothetical protein
MFRDKELKILNAQMDSLATHEPGKISKIIKNVGFTICAGDGEILISKCKLPERGPWMPGLSIWELALIPVKK